MEVDIIPFSLRFYLLFAIELIIGKITLDWGCCSRRPFYLLSFCYENHAYIPYMFSILGFGMEFDAYDPHNRRWKWFYPFKKISYEQLY